MYSGTTAQLFQSWYFTLTKLELLTTTKTTLGCVSGADNVSTKIQNTCYFLTNILKDSFFQGFG
jgi:hypothetical protein